MTGKDLLPTLRHSQSSAVTFGGALAKDLSYKLRHVCIEDKSHYRFDHYLFKAVERWEMLR